MSGIYFSFWWWGGRGEAGEVHTGQCAGLTPGSALRDHPWQGWAGLGIEPWLGVCKLSLLPLYLLQPQDVPSFGT